MHTDPSRTLRSISKTERRPPRSNIASASVGSFQVPRLPVLKDTADGGLHGLQKHDLTSGKQIADDAGNYSSPKHCKGALKTLDLHDIEVQPKLSGVMLTQTAVQDVSVSEGHFTSRPKKLQGGDGISGKNTPKGKKKGAKASQYSRRGAQEQMYFKKTLMMKKRLQRVSLEAGGQKLRMEVMLKV
jgi:hypothetical protein